MTSNEILKADALDILFDNRNKQYGAYALRKAYNNRLGLALGVALGSALLLFLARPKNHPALITVTDHGTVIIKTVEWPKDIKKIIPPPQPKIKVQPFRQRQFTSFVMVNKEKIISPPDIRDVKTDMISNKTVDGALPNGTLIINQTRVEPMKEEFKKNSEWKPDQQEPEFPGGEEAWVSFLRKNLIAPEELEPGEKKTALIKFFVSAEGAITDFEIVQSAGSNFDKEVIRVLKKMPRWKPAVQNGLAVAKAFTQPVTFVGTEQ